MSAVPTLCATGLAMGIVHVVTGPDHLSAIATLSVNVGNCQAAKVGIRWGIGHSIGLVVVGSFFIALENANYGDREHDDSDRVIEIPKRLEDLAAGFVGLFMLALGLSNIYAARARRRGKEAGKNHCGHKHCHHLHHHGDHGRDSDLDPLSCDSLTKPSNIRSYCERKSSSVSHNDDYESPFLENSATASESMGIYADSTSSDESQHDGKKFVSLWVGIFHGVAGPGGVLGVVPAVRLHNPWHSAAYLGSFCASSIATMGLVAALYGSASAMWTRHDDTLAYGVELVSASLSVLVGCAWLVLLHLGILDKVFP